jgi:GNAT superfamily N-acetyltransferase
MKASSSSWPCRFSSEVGSPADLELRPIAPDDLPQFVALCAEHAAFEQAAFFENGQADRLAVLLFGPRPAAYGLVVARGAELLGFATYIPEFSTWDAAYYLHLDCLFLRPELRGRGVGRRVMAAVAAEARQLGCALMQWQTPDFNHAAIAFYQRLGASRKSKVRFYLAAEQLMESN